MLPGSTAGGLIQGPTAGNISTNDPSALIGEGALSIAQVNQLRAELNQKHPLFGLGDLQVAHTGGLQGLLDSKAGTAAARAALAEKSDATALT